MAVGRIGCMCVRKSWGRDWVHLVGLADLQDRGDLGDLSRKE